MGAHPKRVDVEHTRPVSSRILALAMVALSVLVGCVTPVSRQVEALQAADACCSDWRRVAGGPAPGARWVRIPLDVGQALGEFWGHRSYFRALDISGLEGRELEVRSYYQALSQPQYVDPVIVVLDGRAQVMDVWTPRLRRRDGAGFVAPHNEAHLWARLRVPDGAVTAVVLANDSEGVGRRAHAAGEAVSAGDWNSPVAGSGPGRPLLERAPGGLLRIRVHTD